MFLRTFLVVFFTCTSLLGLSLIAHPESGAPQSELNRADVVIGTGRGEVRLDMEVAVTPLEQQIGMMGRSRAGSKAGMYFQQPKPADLSVSMDDMRFPTDIVFIGPDGRIARIEHNVPPQAELDARSPGPVSAYLQVTGGEARKLGLRVGDAVHLDGAAQGA
jgi:uncharacterized membrane protein (UPF0127 family)